MHLIRPLHLMVQRHDRPEFSLEDLLGGGAGLKRHPEWLALAPHLGTPVALSLDDLDILDAVPAEGQARAELESRFDAARVAYLVEAGVLIGDHAAHADLRERDRALRALAWWTPALVAQSFGRWQGVDVAADEARQGKRTLTQLIELHGAPPAETVEHSPREQWLALPPSPPDDFDALLGARATCRNFDPQAWLSLQDCSRLLQRAFGAQAVQALAPDVKVLKKHSPSGGGLHPIEAYLLVQRVQGLTPGLYHYQPLAHALEPLPLPADADLPSLAHELVAGQPWFAQAPVQVVLAARFDRSFWKYRNHAKAWRVLQLDAGHLSQTLALSATEQGLGAFITAALNDECAERLFGLDPLRCGAVAVCGFGARGAGQQANELDPLGRVRR